MSKSISEKFQVNQTSNKKDTHGRKNQEAPAWCKPSEHLVKFFIFFSWFFVSFWLKFESQIMGHLQAQWIQPLEQL